MQAPDCRSRGLLAGSNLKTRLQYLCNLCCSNNTKSELSRVQCYRHVQGLFKLLASQTSTRWSASFGESQHHPGIGSTRRTNHKLSLTSDRCDAVPTDAGVHGVVLHRLLGHTTFALTECDATHQVRRLTRMHASFSLAMPQLAFGTSCPATDIDAACALQWCSIRCSNL